MSKGKQKATETSQPWAPAQPYLKQGMGWLDNLYKSGGMTTDYSGDWVADMTPEQRAAIEGITGTAGSNNDMLGQAAGGLLGLATGQTQVGNWDTIANDTIQRIMPGINSSFAGSGMTGSTLHQQNLSQGLSQGLGMAANDFQNNAVQQQLGATGALGGVLGQIMGNQEAALGAQDRIQQQEQNELDSQYQNSLLGQNADFDALSNYLSVISGIAGLGGQTTGTQKQSAGGMGVLSGLAGMAALFSDRRLKEDVERIGTLDSGLAVYRYRYRGSDQVHMGVMAQDVAQVRPEAVSERHGYLAVDLGGDLMTGLLSKIGGWLGDDTNRMRLAGASHIFGALGQGQSPNVAPFLGAIQEQQQAQQFRDSLGSEDMMSRFSDEERSFLARLPPQVAQKLIGERIFAQPEPTTYGWQTMPDGTLVRTDSTGGITPMGQFGKPQESYRTISGEEAAAMGLDPTHAYNIGPDNKISQIGGGGTNVNVNMGDGAPGLGKLSADYGYVLDPETRQPVIDPATGLPKAAPVPGSPAAQQIQQVAEKEGARDANASRAADIVVQDIDKAIDQVSGWTAGAGSVLSGIPGSAARDLQASLDTVRANIGFDRLQQMREASPTGGALGGIAIQELQMLQAVLGSLDTAQSPEQLRQNLKRLKEVYEPIARKASAYPNAADFGFGGGAAPAEAAAGAQPQAGRRRYNPATGEFE